MVSVFAFYPDDPSSNPAEVYSCYSLNCLKRTKKQKEAGDFNKKSVVLKIFLTCLWTVQMKQNIGFFFASLFGYFT